MHAEGHAEGKVGCLNGTTRAPAGGPLDLCHEAPEQK